MTIEMVYEDNLPMKTTTSRKVLCVLIAANHNA